VESLVRSLKEDKEVSITLKLKLKAMNILKLKGVNIVLIARLVVGGMNISDVYAAFSVGC
jgi:hypothetical protein